MRVLPQQQKLFEGLDLEVRFNPFSLLIKIFLIAAIAVLINFLTSRNYDSKGHSNQEVQTAQMVRFSPPEPF